MRQARVWFARRCLYFSRSDELDDGWFAWIYGAGMVEMISDIPYPHLDANWWLFHTADYISRIHMDADGSATVVAVPPGVGDPKSGKLWIIGRPKTEEGDVLYSCGVPNSYDPHGPNVQLFDYEAIWLTADDCL